MVNAFSLPLSRPFFPTFFFPHPYFAAREGDGRGGQAERLTGYCGRRLEGLRCVWEEGEGQGGGVRGGSE